MAHENQEAEDRSSLIAEAVSWMRADDKFPRAEASDIIQRLAVALESVPATTPPQATMPTRQELSDLIGNRYAIEFYDPAGRAADAILSLLSSGQTTTNDKEK